MFKGKRVTIYVTGSIAAYKSLILVRMLVKKHAKVRIVMTKAAQLFISSLSFQVLSKHQVITDDKILTSDNKITHVDVADNTDLAIVVPATANFIAKIANGIADDISSTSFLATHCKKIVVPAMNKNMLNNPSTKRNIRQLKLDGINVFKTVNGVLAEGYRGNGRMMEPIDIMNQLLHLFNNKIDLYHKRVIVTAGGTIEPIDPVRYITNRSSGKMGYEIAKSARNHGAEVTLISAPTKLTPPSGVKVINITTTEDLEKQVLSEFKHADILIMAAAVSDFKPFHFNNKKIKKNGDNGITIKLQPTTDILKAISKIKKDNQFVVGFAAETNNLIHNANIKLKSKKLDLLVANDVSNSEIGFNSDNNQVTFLRTNQLPVKTSVESKAKVAEKLIQIISQMNYK